MPLRLTLVVALALAAAPVPRAAAQQPFVAVLSGFEQDPPISTPASGLAVVTVDLALHTIRVKMRFNNLSSGATHAGLHGLTAEPGRGTADSATPVPALAGFPLGQTSGTYDQTFFYDNPATFDPAFVAAHGGMSQAPEVFAFGIGDGKAYFNIRTSAYSNGEIRGFLRSAQAADFDLNGIVLGPDLALWRAEYGGISSIADANRDLLVEGSDFLVWQRQLGLQAVLGGGLNHHVQPVPEPAALAPAGLLVCGAARMRRSATAAHRKKFLRKSHREMSCPGPCLG